MAKEKLNTYWGVVNNLHLPEIATIERNFISSSFYSIIANRFLAKNCYHSLITSSLHLFMANRLALATSFLLLFITSFLVPSSLHSQIPSYVPTNGLVGYWPFNGNANDESGNGNHGTVNGATLTADRNGNANSAYGFNGVNNKIEVQHNQSLNIGIITISTWFLSNSFLSIDGNQQQIISKREYTGEGYNYQLGLGKDPSNGFDSNAQNAVFSDWTCGPSNQFRLDYASTQLLESTWYHLVFIKNLSSTSLFINGIEVLTNSPSCEIPTGNTLPLWFGGRPGGGGRHFFNGLLDDIAIYNRALTQEEITALYNGTTAISGCTNSTACNYNASATQDDGSCTFPAQTYLTCAGTCINDADNDGTCDELETPTLPSYLPSNGLVGYWPFNGNANDESGNGNHGTVNGATLTNDRNGNANSAYSFDGINDLISIADNSKLDSLTANSFTVSLWFLGGDESGNNFDGLLSRGWNNADAFFGFQIGRSGNQYQFQSNGPSCGGPIVMTAPGFWHNITQVYSLAIGTVTSYFDGSQVSLTEGCSNIISSLNNNFSLKFGVEREGNLYFKGLLDDIAIYNRALTPEEITALYNGTTTGGGGGNGGTAGTPAPSVPQGIPYQAMIRDNSGAALMNSPVTVRFSLRQDAIDGTVEYQETHNLTTNAFGLVNTHFGSGTATQGTFANINWSNTTKFIQVEANSGSGFVDMGTQQMMSVPFALKANSANEANKVKNAGLPVYANNAAALAGGLVAGEMYRTATGDLKIVY